MAKGTAFADMAAKQGLTVTDLPPFLAAMNPLEGLPAALRVYELNNALGMAKVGDVTITGSGRHAPCGVPEGASACGGGDPEGWPERLLRRKAPATSEGNFGEWFRQKMEDSWRAAMRTPEEPTGTGRPGKTR